MYRDCERNVEKQLPVVVGIESMLGEVDFLAERFYLNEITALRVVADVEKIIRRITVRVRRFEAILPRGV
jgi:hypothetical protein